MILKFLRNSYNLIIIEELSILQVYLIIELFEDLVECLQFEVRESGESKFRINLVSYDFLIA